jgi:hypothetical protein
MTRFMFAGLLALLLPAAGPVDDKEDLAKAAAKTRELQNYEYKGRLSVDGVPFLADPIDYSGAYVKDRGFTAAMGPFGSIFRLDKKVAVKDPESGGWILIRPGTKIGDGALASQIPMIARGLRPPHEELKKFEDRFKEIKKREAAEKVGEISCAVYEGPLTEAGVRFGLPAGVGFVLGKGEFEGTGRAWVGDGRILRFEAECRAELEDGEKTVEVKYSRTTEFLKIGKATVEMPAEVKKLFEE